MFDGETYSSFRQSLKELNFFLFFLFVFSEFRFIDCPIEINNIFQLATPCLLRSFAKFFVSCWSRLSRLITDRLDVGSFFSLSYLSLKCKPHLK